VPQHRQTAFRPSGGFGLVASAVCLSVRYLGVAAPATPHRRQTAFPPTGQLGEDGAPSAAAPANGSLVRIADLPSADFLRHLSNFGFRQLGHAALPTVDRPHKAACLTILPRSSAPWLLQCRQSSNYDSDC